MILDKKNYWPQNAVIYQIYPRSFKDSNNDGIGDINGIIEKLDYLQDLGINTIWISPIFMSPMADFGYDVSNYCAIEPMFGTLQDFDKLVTEIHDREMKLLLDFVPSHTSIEHPWFLESKSSKNNPKREWYIWKDANHDGSAPNNWISIFGGSTWEYDKKTKQYYLHTFLKDQADLNWRNPEVQKAMMDALRFWLKKGVDGFRIDAFNHMYKHEEFLDDPNNPDYIPEKDDPYERHLHIYSKNQPELVSLISLFANTLAEYGNKFMITESYIDHPTLISFYKASTHLHAPFNFDFIFLPWNAKAYKELIDRFDASVGKHYSPTYVLGNHDRPRVASRIGKTAARVAVLMQLTLRGIPTIYYGEELGMTNSAIPLRDIQDPFEKNVPGMGLGRDPERTPMQWNTQKYAGFSQTKPWLPIPEQAQKYNVATELKDPQSMLSFYKALLHYRKTAKALLYGEYTSLGLNDIPVFGYIRTHEKETLLVLLNFSDQPQNIMLGYKQAHIILNTLLDKPSGQIINLENFSLRPHEGYLLKI